MKRNITVNIFGSLYPMDEDAYAMLNAYIVNMRDYFSRQPDGKEIADDIEGRVAELMSELRHNGTEAISIEHIEEIINRVGKPEQFIEDEEETVIKDIPPIPSSAPKKKLFRDPEHKLLGGVFSGFGCYLGVNPLWLRLAYIIIIFWLSLAIKVTLPIILLLICTYFVCWWSIPLAANPAERLQMKGEPVNLSNMCDEFLTSTKELFTQDARTYKDGQLASGIISALRWIFYAFGFLFVILCVIAFVMVILSVIGAFSYPWNLARGFLGDNHPIMLVLDSSPNWLIWTVAISLLTFIGLTLYLVIHFIFRILGRVKPLSLSLRITCLTLWMISLVVCTTSSTNIAGKAASYHHFLLKRKQEKENKETAKDKQEKQLIEAGWTVLKANNIKNFTNQGEHYSGDNGITYLDAGSENNSLDMEYDIEKRLKVDPGVYRLEAKARTNGKGAEIYAENGSGIRYSDQIPVCGNKGGTVWKNAEIALRNDTAQLLPNRHYLDKLTKVNQSQGYGWSDIVIDNITVGQDSIIRFGVTNVSPSYIWDGTWLSATSFELKRQE